ncbi:hypothetical protein [Acinetobacter boissieri]|uniref:Uncharacterized protein n=1 Tax=Acinetobacter boissieri TaxID=1219383 RepID=A0A1G6JTY2_9GAMM|nr:hypothetical protein [Acinetobacter boissieri]SDC22157.1 hypothetical protein SAMN05421733_11268 [Acinetobacter boissieri]
MSIYKKIFFIIISTMTSITNAKSCLSKDLIDNSFTITPIGNQVILNNKSVELKQVLSSNCSVECYMQQLSKKGFGVSKQGHLLYIHEKKGITLEILNESKNSFQGRLICQTEEKFKLLELPPLFSGQHHSSDLQSTDGNHISRTIFFKNINKTVLSRQLAIFSKEAQESDIQKNFAYFLFPNSSEVYLTYNESATSKDVVAIYKKPRNNND